MEIFVNISHAVKNYEVGIFYSNYKRVLPLVKTHSDLICAAYKNYDMLDKVYKAVRCVNPKSKKFA